MKRYVKAATASTLKNTLIKGFTNAGCSNVSIIELTKTHCRISLTLPNGNSTTFTAWVNSRNKNIGKPKDVNDITFKIDPTWVFRSDGTVEDSDGNAIGTVYSVKLNTTTSKQRTRRDYDLNSVRTDSGDVIIDHPEKSKTYVDVVNSLSTRTITHRS